MPVAVTAAEFTAAMARLGPFEPAPGLAIGVSGGPDSMALAWLASEWARDRGGAVLALIVDHGLRQGSAAEAAAAASQLAKQGIAARVLTLAGLRHGSGLAERARSARFAALLAACAEAGLLHLLLAHHAADQAETVLIRSLGGSGPHGLAAIAPAVELAQLRVLRPLLDVAPVRLRAMLESAGVPWINDPSNADTKALRPRLRLLRADRDGVGAATRALVDAAAAAGEARARGAADAAACLAEVASIRPEGFALLSGKRLQPAALAALIQTMGGAAYPANTKAVAALAEAPHAATLAGVRLLPAGSLGEGMLLVREAAAMASPVPAHAGAFWDGRFRLTAKARLPHGASFGALGADAARLRRLSQLPAAVLRTLPAVRDGKTLLAVPHLGYPDPAACACAPVVFSPARPVAGAPLACLQTPDVNGDA